MAPPNASAVEVGGGGVCHNDCTWLHHSGGHSNFNSAAKKNLHQFINLQLHELMSAQLKIEDADT